MIQTFPKGLKKSLAKRKIEQESIIKEQEKEIAEQEKYIKEMREFGAKYGLKGKEMAEAFKKYKAGNYEPTKTRSRSRSPSPVSITHDFEKPKKEKKIYKESNIMKARSDLKKKGDKYTVDTEMNVKEGLDGKTKRALKKSIEDEVKKKIKGFKKPVGFGVEKIVLDYSSSEDEKPKKRGRPKKGKGIEDFDDSSSDEDDIKEYGKILKHLVGHIKDPKEKIDKNDYKQAIELIKKIKSKKGGTIRGRGDKEEYKPMPLVTKGSVVAERPIRRDFSASRERAKQRTLKAKREEDEKREKVATINDNGEIRYDFMEKLNEARGHKPKIIGYRTTLPSGEQTDPIYFLGKSEKYEKALEKALDRMEEGSADEIKKIAKEVEEGLEDYSKYGHLRILQEKPDLSKDPFDNEGEGKGIRKRGRPRKYRK